MAIFPDSPRVLLIEDNIADASLLRTVLDKVAPLAKLDHQASVAAGVRRLQSRPFDFVLVDLTLPDGEGAEVVSRVRAHAEHTPVIVVSNHLDEELNARCIEAGATDYLCKSRLTVDTLRRTLLYSWVRPRSRPGFRPTDTMRTVLGVGVGDSERSPEAAQPLSDLHPVLWRRLTSAYRKLLHPHFDSLVVRRPALRKEMVRIARQLGEVGATPGDVMALHWAALEPLVRDLGPARQEGYSKDGRLLALEVMGYLADHYRRGAGVRRGGPG